MLMDEEQQQYKDDDEGWCVTYNIKRGDVDPGTNGTGKNPYILGRTWVLPVAGRRTPDAV
jgi:hypothetical protein